MQKRWIALGIMGLCLYLGTAGASAKDSALRDIEELDGGWIIEFDWDTEEEPDSQKKDVERKGKAEKEVEGKAEKEVKGKAEKEEEQEPISSFLGYYLAGQMGYEVLYEEGELLNPEVLYLGFDEEGRLFRYTGLYYSTLGTTYYYDYDSYRIEGNVLTCWYSTMRSYYGPMETKPGKHVYEYHEDPEPALYTDELTYYKRVEDE